MNFHGMYWTKSYATNHMIIDELNFKSSVMHITEMSRMFESYILARKCKLEAFKLSWVIRMGEVE